MSRTDATLRITRQQYRTLAEATKAVGLALNLSTFKRMGCWGSYSPWALLLCNDATNPDTTWDERSLITLASSIDAAKFRAAGAGRPELDWACLDDEEIFPFVVWHEIGHRMNNFDAWGIMTIEDGEIRETCRRRVTFVNELLADRYAWEHLRPGEPLPLCENGIRLREKAAESLRYLDAHAPRMNRFHVRQLRSGQYLDVPEYMLATAERAAFLGPKVSRHLVEQRAAYFRKRADEGAPPLY